MSKSERLDVLIGDGIMGHLHEYKKNTGIGIKSHIVFLIEDDIKKNPEKYKSHTPLSVQLSKCKNIDQKVECVLRFYHCELSVRGITQYLCSRVAPIDRVTLCILVNKTLSNEKLYYKTRTDGRKNLRFGLKEWL